MNDYAKLNWLDEWLPEECVSIPRYAPPYLHEQTAAAGAAKKFTEAVLKLADAMDAQHDTPAEKARNITAVAAVAAQQVEQTATRTGPELDPDEWEDPEPETIKAREQIQYCQGVAYGLASRAKDRLKLAGMPWDPDETADQGWEDKEWFPECERVPALAAAMTGHAAAARWLMRQIRESARNEQDEQAAGAILALWTHQTQLQIEPPDNLHQIDRHLTQANQEREETLRELDDPQFQEILNHSRPVQISPEAEPDMQDPDTQAIITDVDAAGDESAVFDWDPDNPGEALMAYRYQGCNHIKRLAEPYQHPMDVHTALSHCNDLESDVIFNEDPSSPDYHYLLHQALLNRSVALAELHHTPAKLVVALAEAARQAVPERSRLEALIRTLCDDYAEPAILLTNQHAPRHNNLDETQTKTVLQAARSAGATDPQLRDLALKMGLNAQEIRDNNIPDAQRVPWENTRHILEIAYSLKPPPSGSWLRAAAQLGWPPDGPEVQRLAAQLNNLAYYGADQNDQAEQGPKD